MDARAFLAAAGDRSRDAWNRDRRLLTFEAVLARMAEDPYALGRSAVQFAVDAVDHFGVRRVRGIGGPVVRHALWDAPFAGGRGAVHGQEAVQERIVRTLRSAAEEGRLARLLVLHGPNGSAKSTLVECLLRGVAHYASLPEGALYRFHWVFPRRGDEQEGLGFGGGGRAPRGAAEEGDSFALLPPEELGARIPCDLRDHPLLVLPREARREFLASAGGGVPPRRSLAHLVDGELCPRCHAIASGLLAAYHGDLGKVLRHVQVERWYVDPGFRAGAVVVPPMQSVDAGVREAAGPPAGAALPPHLQHVPLPEFSGDLVDANRGLLEFSDFLKRPVELWKYLLTTAEKGTVALGPYLVRLDLVALATTNDTYLDAFKESPDWNSFKARMELVPVPYLREPSKEEAIYRDFAGAVAPGRHVAPRALAALARFAVLTRLRRPDPAAHPAEIRDAVASLTPPGKLRLYETGEAPEGLDESVRRLLAAAVPALRDERRDSLHYEGRHGASAREIRSVLGAAAADPEGGDCLGVGVLFRHLRALLGEKTVYEFLRIEPAEGYHRAADFADEAEARAARLSLEDLQEALELVPPGEYLRRFERYVAHAVAFDRGEKVRPPGGGPPEAPDGEVLHSVEKLLELRETPAAFRASLVSRLGAFGVEHPGTKPDLALLFPGILRALREEYFRGMREKVRRVEGHILAHGTPEFDRLDRPHRELVERALRNLETRFGYCPRCAREAVAGMKSAAGR